MGSLISELMGQPDEQMDHMLGIDERRKGECSRHGNFIDIHYSGKGRVSEGWKGCPECADEAIQARMREEERQRQLEMMRERAVRFVAKSGIPKRFADKGFDEYRPVSGKSASVLRKIQEYGDLLASGKHEGRSLILLGNVGNGKTHLSCALLRDVILRTCKPGEYWTFAELIREVKGSWRKSSDYSEQDVYDQFAKPELVILDEVGMQNFTEFEQTVAYEAINARYLLEKPTVLITNLPASDLNKCLGERVVDRLRENGGKALGFDWLSYRQGGDAA
ncbi:ATP-binding protein [Marinobacter sp. CA1]|uniref:ATP-binding protein n=1 Tax=Marinobacter sp. CA1 TaxID=2817656 RepID=UPI001D068F89|nr:ATP-binding protein [Marinobacter sp. CA1]UDL03997.1 ATP-binding protein [Marinobacter sp. CA1]